MHSRTWRRAPAVLALVGLLAAIPVATAADAPVTKADDKPAPTLKTAIAGVGDISVEVARIDKRLSGIEQSVAEINASLKHMEAIDKSLVPVGELTRPQGITALVNEVSDVAFSRGVSLILIATACAGALIVLLAFLARWILANRPK